MHSLTLKTKEKTYDILIGQGFEAFASEMNMRFSNTSSIFIITDENVSKLYANILKEALSQIYSKVFILSIKAGEESKSLKTISDIYEFLLKNNADRGSVLVALGGGVVGDITGFVSATYMRGTNFVQVPTTLLAMVDSSVGGKTAVDFMGYKNIIGSFKQPDLVYMNIGCLSTLPEREFSGGMAEVIKHGLILDNNYYQYICDNIHNIRKENTLPELIRRSVELKASIVSQDEHDRGIREILNFGHTFGHGIEAVKFPLMSHGECVALGMLSALKISQIEQKSYLSLLDCLKLPKKIDGADKDSIYAAILKDKKSKSGAISFILLKEIGSAFSRSLSHEEIMQGIDYITEGK